MWNLIVRMYDKEERARDAVAKLREAGFSDDAIFELAPGAAQSVASAIEVGRLMGYRAKFYAERVKQGRSLVAVEAPFGRGEQATQILDGCGPVDLDLKVPEDAVKNEWGEGAPLSHALGLPVLSRNNPTPLSDTLGMSTLARSDTYLTSKLPKWQYILSGPDGPRLSKNPAPLSSMLGLPLLSHRASRTKLSSNPAPFSSALGLPTLSKNPTPLSSALGLALLSEPN
jgi:hypothetical protein